MMSVEFLPRGRQHLRGVVTGPKWAFPGQPEGPRVSR
jgi:hypothetical protein